MTKDKLNKQQFFLQDVMIFHSDGILSSVFGILDGKILSLILKSCL